MKRTLFYSVFVIAGLLAGTAVGRETITRLPEVRRLSVAEAEKGVPVELEAQVVRAHPLERNFFAFADGEGIYVVWSAEDASMENRPVVGDWVKIRGNSLAGEFSPAIQAHDVDVLGHRPMPEARPFRLDDLYSLEGDCDWVSVEGRLTDMAVELEEGYGRIILTLELNESIPLGIQAPHQLHEEDNIKRFRELMFKRVRFNAVVGSVYNGQRQLTGRSFSVQSADDFELLDEDETEGQSKYLPILSLMRVGNNHLEMVRTRGTVTYASSREIFLRGEGASLRVAVGDGGALSVGQQVEVAGYVWPQPISPAFRARTVKVVEAAEEVPQPEDIVIEQLLGEGLSHDLLDTRLNYDLVKMRGQLVDVGKSFSASLGLLESPRQRSLLCRSGQHLFEARLPIGMELGDDLKPGAELELTGICNLIPNKRLYSRVYFNGLWLQLRNAADIKVIYPAPWWTPQRLAWGLSIVLFLLFLLLGWSVTLRKTVSRQTNTIGEQIKRESILNERQRIARELHDTLEQGLTALSIQLRSLYRKIKKDPVAGLNAVETVESMLRVCREESRASIQDLRGGLLEAMGLDAAVRQTLGPRVEETPIDLRVEVEGAPKRLTLFAEHQLLRLITEAAINAMQHAGPRLIIICLHYAEQQLTVSVEDDGCGFDTQEMEKPGHFGVRGMFERANRLHGILDIESEIGKGSRIKLTMSMEGFSKEEKL